MGLWDRHLLKDTLVIVVAGGVVTGFRALALKDGTATWRAEVRSVVTLVVVIQWLSNLHTFPYLVELSLVPLVVLLGGMQVVATLDEEHMAARPLIYGMVILLGLALLGWSTYRVWASVGATEWEKVGESFALAFWLPTALLPAIYIAALSMQYGKTISMMKTAQLPSLGARLDLYLHHKLNLRRLSAFSLSPGRARQYARAGSRAERLAILQSTSD